MSAVVRAGTKVVKWVGDAIEDVLDFAVDEIIEPVFVFVGGTVKALMDDPLATIAKVVAIATYNAWAIPLIDGASVAANGGSFGDVMESVAISYVAQKVGGELGDWAGEAAGNALGEGVSAGTRELVASMVSQGTEGATTAILYGEDPFEAFARGGISAAVSAAMGKIGEKIGFESTVTDPATSKTTTRTIPNVVQNMISTALAAELTGQEITPALMAGALTRGLITAELVQGYIDKDQSMGDREIAYVTAAIQRTTAIALSGGSGEQAAAALQGVMSAYGMEALHDAIDNSGIGDFINNSIDKMSGDYQETVRIADELDAQVLSRNAAYEGYEGLRTEINDDLTALEAMHTHLEIARERAMDEREGGGGQAQTAYYDNLLAKYQEAAADLNAKYAEYKPRMDAYEQQINDAQDKFTELETELGVAQGNLQLSAERLNEELQPVYSAAERAYVATMSPNFNEAEYKYLNGLSDDTDAFTHYLTNGQHDNVYTNQADYDRAVNNNRNQAITKILEAAGIDPSGLSTDVLKLAVNAINDTYGTPQELEELLNNEAAINDFAGALSGAVADASEYSNAVLDDTTRARLESLGFDTAGGMDGEALTNEEKAALHTADNRGSNEISLGADTTWQDVADNNAVVTYLPDGNREWRNISVLHPPTIEWDPESGRWLSNTSYDEQGGAWTTTRVDELNVVQWLSTDDPVTVDLDEVDLGVINIYYHPNNMQGGDYLNTIKNAGKEMGYADSMIDFVSGVLDYAKESGNEWIIDTAANVVKAGGGILGAFNGVVALAGIAPPDTALGKFADALVKLGENTNTDEYKANLAEIQQMMGQPIDPNAPWYDRALEKAENILGAFSEHPTTFLAEYIGVEATQELVPLLIGGGASLAAKGAARFAGMGAQVSARIGSKVGIVTSVATDIAESFGGTASEAYDTALEVALKTGMSEKDAKAYALNLAVETGTVAAFMTAVTMGVGGMALEKALIGDGVGGKMATVFGELASRALEGGKIMIKEGVAESIEEGVATAYREGHLYQIDPTRDVAGEVAGAALMGFIVGGPVAGGAYGVAQTGDAVSNAISAINPQVNTIIKNAVAAGITADELIAVSVELNNLGITDPVIQNNIMNIISDSNYTSTEEVSTAFSSNQDYKPTQAEIDALVGAKGDADIQARVDTYIDPRYTDPAEAANMFIDTFGYTPTDAEIAQFVGQTAESTQETAIGDYVDPRQTTETEARAFFDSLGYTPTDAEVAQFVGQNSETTQQTAVGAYVDPRYTDAAEAKAFLEGLGYTPTDAEVARFTGQVNEAQQETAIGEYVDPRLVNAEEVAAAYEALGLERPTDADIQALIGQYMESDLAGKAEENLPTARYNSIMDILNNFTGEAGVSEEMQAALDIVKNDMINALGDLGLEVAAIDQTVNSLTNAVGAIASGDADATGLYGYIDEAVQNLKDAGLTNEQVTKTINEIIGSPATGDAEATGIYATLDALGTNIDNLNDLSVDDVNSIVTDAIGSLNDISTEDVETIVADAISGLENISEEDVQGVVNNIVGAPATDDAGATGIYAVIDSLENLSEEDVETIVSNALSGLENISEEDIQSVVNNIVGAPATDDAGATGIYAVIDSLENLSEEDVSGIVANIVGQPATDDSEATGLYATIGDLNNISEEEVTAIVTEALGGLENISTDDVSNVVNSIIGNPATDNTDASGIYGYIDSGLSSVQESVLDKLSEYEDAGIARDEALSTAIADVAEDLGTAEDNILAQIGTPATGDAAATGIYAALDNNTDAILEILGAPATDDAAATGIYGYIDSAVYNLGTDLAALAGNVGTAAEYDADGNLLTEATGIYAQVDALMAQGMTNAEAIASLAVEFGVAFTDLTNLINDHITNSQTGLEEKIDKAVEDIGVDIEDMETEILDKMAEYELAGIDRDEALTTAISDLATELGLTEEALLDQITSTETNLLTELGLTEESILDRINEAETSLSDQIIETETNLSGEIDAVAELVGKAAQEVTQADIDFVADIIAQAEVISDAEVIQQYDVTGDGVIDINDQTLLESILAGNTDVTVADTSIFAPTGVYDAIFDTETELQEDIAQTQDQITEMEQNIQTTIEQEAVRAGLRDFLGMAMESPDMGGQQVTVKTPDLMQLDYLYDFSSIFANPTQQNLFPSPYAKGGQVEDTTDKLLRIIGGS